MLPRHRKSAKSQIAKNAIFSRKNNFFRNFPKNTPGDCCKECVYKIWASYDDWKVLKSRSGGVVVKGRRWRSRSRWRSRRWFETPFWPFSKSRKIRPNWNFNMRFFAMQLVALVLAVNGFSIPQPNWKWVHLDSENGTTDRQIICNSLRGRLSRYFWRVGAATATAVAR